MGKRAGAVVAPFGEETKTLWAQWDSLRLVDGIMYRVWEHPSASDETLQIVVPKTLRKQIFDFLHDSKTGGHFGINKTIGKIKEKFYCPKLRDNVKKLCAQCDLCSARKGPSRKIKAPLASYVVGSPMERVAVDVLGPLPVSENGNKYISIAMDYFTKCPEAYALPNQKAETVAKVLVDQFVSRFGTPVELHSDQRRNFESRVFSEINV
ncbi:Retrovirus-related Pol poly from transposon [Paramuricea clavata]|uniref:Retrovirus-related Pol poly from transposon n=1 Tax=Paramuricea clavata TaxID=317549 RepID=A0A7D9EV27_PARCT|nr:Retrovirus-related Pol poly from transposon [Paramuricea clavata]